MHYLLYLNIIPGGKHWWVAGITKDGFAIRDDAKNAKKYKHKATVYRAAKRFGLNVLIVGQHTKYMVVKRDKNKKYYLSPAEENWSLKLYPEASWRSGLIGKRLALRLSKTKAMHYAARLDATIVAVP